MKRTLFVTMMTANVFAVERQQLMPLIEEAASKRESAYVETRNSITVLGTNTLPVLAEIAVDESLPWQQRLVARICYERIGRKTDIAKLIETDWYSHPNFNPEWTISLAGPEGAMRIMVVPDLKEVGLWYYYLEIEWKITGEKAKIRKNGNFDYWPFWCTFAVKDNPDERIWFLRIYSEMLTYPSIYPQAERLYKLLTREENDKVSIHTMLLHMPEPPFRLGTKIIKPAKGNGQ